MSISDIALPALGFLLILNSILAKKGKIGKKQIGELVIGLAIMGFSLYSLIINGDNIRAANDMNKDLTLSMKNLSNQIRIDSIEKEDFRKYLRDTFGIEQRGDTAIIINNTTYIEQAKDQQIRAQLQPESLPDSLNYSVNFKNNILQLSPKEGRWLGGFMAVDTSVHVYEGNMIDEGMGMPTEFDKIIVKGTIYYTNINRINDRPVYFGFPMKINLTKNPNQYVIFGDMGTPNRYVFKQGRVQWIPN